MRWDAQHLQASNYSIMSKFNTQSTSTKATSYEGGSMYKTSREFELYTTVVTEFLADKFYETADARVTRLKTLISECDPTFVMKLAVYAREEMYLRSVPLLLLILLQSTQKVDVSVALTRVIQRADELTEALACYDAHRLHKNESVKPIPHSIMRGIGNAFAKFNEYQFSKYNRQNKKFKLIDVLYLTHPKPRTKQQQELYAKIKNDSLATADTWETTLSEVGQQATETEEERDILKKEAWTESVNKMGYMALLRNLRNLLQAGVDNEVIEKVVLRLSLAEEVARSKQFPFRFYSAIKAVAPVNSPATAVVLGALDKALEHSAENIQFLKKDESVLFICDTSGSMDSNLSDKSGVRLVEVGAVLSAIASTKAKFYSTIAFATNMEHVPLSTSNTPTEKVQKILSVGSHLGGGTELHPVLESIIDKKQKFDKVCVFTDMQVDRFYSYGKTTIQGLWAKYTKDVSPDAKLYVFNLAGYGMSFSAGNDKSIIEVAGWSDKIFDMLKYIDEGDKFFDIIMAIEL